MPIHIQEYNKQTNLNESKLVWEIDSEISLLENCFQLYMSKTGNRIDEYTDTFILPGSLLPLVDAISEAIAKERNQNTLELLNYFLGIVQRAVNKNKGLAFIGE